MSRLETDQEWVEDIALPDKLTTEDDFVRIEREHRIIHELVTENLLVIISLMMASVSKAELTVESKDWEQAITNHNTLTRRRRTLGRLLRDYLRPSGQKQDDQPGD